MPEAPWTMLSLDSLIGTGSVAGAGKVSYTTEWSVQTLTLSSHLGYQIAQ